ncbi:uncharacterized protein LOC143020051 [Oratosquilla oratoria]|uniref:uncharacterized protein LOC143020051 n=1 Tax=Oratosquilla oratoria TaxID=337810 RepID=UPI003F7640D8
MATLGIHSSVAFFFILFSAMYITTISGELCQNFTLRNRQSFSVTGNANPVKMIMKRLAQEPSLREDISTPNTNVTLTMGDTWEPFFRGHLVLHNQRLFEVAIDNPDGSVQRQLVRPSASTYLFPGIPDRFIELQVGYGWLKIKRENRWDTFYSMMFSGKSDERRKLSVELSTNTNSSFHFNVCMEHQGNVFSFWSGFAIILVLLLILLLIVWHVHRGAEGSWTCFKLPGCSQSLRIYTCLFGGSPEDLGVPSKEAKKQISDEEGTADVDDFFECQDVDSATRHLICTSSFEKNN